MTFPRPRISQYLERFSELKTWMQDTKIRCREQGYVETLFGRKCHIPTIKDSNPARCAFAERQAINAPIQGTAADIIKRAMARLPGALERAGWWNYGDSLLNPFFVQAQKRGLSELSP